MGHASLRRGSRILLLVPLVHAATMLHDLQWIRLGLPASWERRESSFRAQVRNSTQEYNSTLEPCLLPQLAESASPAGLAEYRQAQLELAGQVGSPGDAQPEAGVGPGVAAAIEGEWSLAKAAGLFGAASAAAAAPAAGSEPPTVPRVLHQVRPEPPAARCCADSPYPTNPLP